MGKTEGTSALKEGDTYTLDDWKSWPEGERWELIGGVAYNMSPAPRVPHQNILANLAHALYDFLEDASCESFIAPVDVFLPDAIKDSAETVVQPDVMVVCDQEKVQDDGIHGAPDFIAEILSPATAYKDLNEKKTLYELAGVREYWLVSPVTRSVFKYILKDGRYGPVTEVMRGGTIESAALPGFVWQVPEPKRKGSV
jgi:Uma2 family endonuclease